MAEDFDTPSESRNMKGKIHASTLDTGLDLILDLKEEINFSRAAMVSPSNKT